MARLAFKANIGRQSLRGPYASGGSRGGTYNDTISARQGMKGVVSNYQRLVKHLEELTPDILYGALKPTFEKSKEYCPKDTGALAASGYLDVQSLRGITTVEMGYGRGGNPSYAVTVHENMEWRHKAPTRAKWLQVALSEDADEIQSRIYGSYKQVIR